MSTDDPVDGVALCLSGGGYRAMLFHVGVVWRLHDAGWLERLDRVSSVSGGSITAGALALAWPRLAADGLEDAFVAPVRALAGRTVDQSSVLVGALTSDTVSERVSKAYRKHLFGDATLQDLPDHPRFVINATSVQSGALFRFSKPYMADYRVGRVDQPDVALADAVAASSAFPPVLSPFELDLRDATWVDEPGQRPRRRRVPRARGALRRRRLRQPRPRDGLEGVPHGPRLRRRRPDEGRARPRPRLGPPPLPRPRRDRQPGARAAQAPVRRGVHRRRAPRAPTGACAATSRTSASPTRCRRRTPRRSRSRCCRPGSRGVDGEVQDRVINWGYAACDAALRAHVDPALPAPGGFPYPAAGVGAA